MIENDAAALNNQQLMKPAGAGELCRVYPHFAMLALLLPLFTSPAVVAAGATTRPAAMPAVSVQSLLQEMVDRDRVARYPDPTFESHQSSSYDRHSIAPDQAGWFANQDAGQYVRTETIDGRQEHVLLDAKGSGAVTRIFMGVSRPNATALDGTIRVYIDGSPRPVVQKHAEEMLGGSFLGPPLIGATENNGGGRSCFLPIPFASSCKITCDDAEPLTYDIEYRTYPLDTAVRSFSGEELAAAKPVLDVVQKQLLESPADAARALKNLTTTPAQHQQHLEPDGVMSMEFDGPAAIRQLSVQITAPDLAQALRSTLLSIQFDEEPTVWCPVGDFFGSGIGLNPYHDWTKQVERDGPLGGTMTCCWVMPFARSCKIELHNLGLQPIDAALGPVVSNKWAWDLWSMHFHAAWRQQFPIHTKAHDGTMDWNAIEIHGAGVYVGQTLAIHNAARAWWGDGDEKVYVDGERFPSHFGTSTANYFGVAFGDHSGAFASPFESQPRADGNGRPGYVTLTRNRALDSIAFTKSLKFDWEIWHWAATDMAYAATTYWYALPGATSNGATDDTEVKRSVGFGP
jgi:hypothetical protein